LLAAGIDLQINGLYIALASVYEQDGERKLAKDDRFSLA
jgi:hypothetical protein